MLLTELSGMSRIIDCAESMWMTGVISWLLGALFGGAIVYFLRDWDL